MAVAFRLVHSVSLARWLGSALLAGALTFGTAAPARTADMDDEEADAEPAADPAALNRMVALNRQALTAVERGRGAAAKETLLGAVVYGKGEGLAQHPVMARTYLHLGAVHLTPLKDKAAAIRYLKMAVKIRPEIQLTPALATPALAAALKEAGGRPEPIAATPDKPKAASAPTKPTAASRPSAR